MQILGFLKKLGIYKSILILAFLIYSIVWSYITVMRYLSYNSGVLDLGVSAAILYNLFHTPLTLYSNGQPTLALNKMIYFLIAPFFNIYPNPAVLLVFQSIWIASAIFPIYGITKILTKDEKIGVYIALTYLFYFPTAGVNWFDFHYMALMPPLFLSGFYFYLKSNYKVSILFMGLAIITDFLVPIIMGIFSLLIYFQYLKNKEDKKKLYYSIFLGAFSVLIFGIIIVYFGIYYLYYWTNYRTIAYYPVILQTNLIEKLLFLFYLTIPLLFIPFLGYESLLLIIPYLGFAYLNDYSPYVTPMFYQYPSLITPFLFVSLAYGLKNINRIFKKIDLKKLKKIAVSILIINILLALVFTPLGPFNENIVPSYQLKDHISITKQDLALNDLISLIPKGSSVLVQDNMPQLVVGYDWILPELMNNTTYPDYVITDPYSLFFDHYSLYFPPKNITMINAFNNLYSSGNYGIYAEEYGMILLKYGYHAPPTVFKNLHQPWSYSNFIFNSQSYSKNGAEFLDNITNGSIGWYGPYTFLAPGNYSITLSLISTNNSFNNTVTFQIVSSKYYDSPQVLLLEKTINGKDFKDINKIQNFTFNVSISSYYDLVEYRGFYMKWNGDLGFVSVTVNQNHW